MHKQELPCENSSQVDLHGDISHQSLVACVSQGQAQHEIQHELGRRPAYALAVSQQACRLLGATANCCCRSSLSLPLYTNLPAGAHLAIRSAKVDVGEVFWEASAVEEHAGLHDLLCQDACHAQHGPSAILQLCLSVPAPSSRSLVSQDGFSFWQHCIRPQALRQSVMHPLKQSMPRLLQVAHSRSLPTLRLCMPVHAAQVLATQVSILQDTAELMQQLPPMIYLHG